MKNSQKMSELCQFKKSQIFCKKNSGVFLVESFICTKSSKKWAKPSPLTLQMVLMKDYTSVLNIMKLKFGKSAKKPSKEAQKEKKSSKIFSKFRSLANFESL